MTDYMHIITANKMPDYYRLSINRLFQDNKWYCTVLIQLVFGINNILSRAAELLLSFIGVARLYRRFFIQQQKLQKRLQYLSAFSV
jgi:hypothetical protein